MFPTPFAALPRPMCIIPNARLLEFMTGILWYVMVIYDYDLLEYNIWHMMIDKNYQGKGYGKAAMKQCLEYIAQKPFGNSGRVVLTCNKENLPALALYRGLGFIETGNKDEDEVELALTL